MHVFCAMDKKNNIPSRIKEIRASLFNGDNQKFAEFMNETESTTSDWSNRRAGVSVIAKLAAKLPDINYDWLLMGRGEMSRATSSQSESSAICKEGTPLLPVEAWGGSLDGSSIAVLAEQCKKYNVPISNIDFLIPIAGDSMMPDYCPGDIVAIKKINERAFIEWGKVYVLDTCNGVVIKEIQPSEEEGRIVCISRNNPDKYRPFEVSLSPEEFYGMYAVKGTVRLS